MKTTGLLSVIALMALSQPAQAGRQDQNDSSFFPPNNAYDSHGRAVIVRKVQLALGAAGYYVADNRGNYCSETRTAVRRYQRDMGLPMTNKIDAATLRSLGLE